MIATNRHEAIEAQLRAKYGSNFINKCSSVELFLLQQARDFDRDDQTTKEVIF